MYRYLSHTYLNFPLVSNNSFSLCSCCTCLIHVLDYRVMYMIALNYQFGIAQSKGLVAMFYIYIREIALFHG